MQPIRCPSCNLRWNIRDDAPSVITCPRCLAGIAKPQQTGVVAPAELEARPVRVLPLEHEVVRDQRGSTIGMWLVALMFVFAMILGLQDARSRRRDQNVLIALAIVAVATIAFAIAAACSRRLN